VTVARGHRALRRPSAKVIERSGDGRPRSPSAQVTVARGHRALRRPSAEVIERSGDRPPRSSSAQVTVARGHRALRGLPLEVTERSLETCATFAPGAVFSRESWVDLGLSGAAIVGIFIYLTSHWLPATPWPFLPSHVSRRMISRGNPPSFVHLAPSQSFLPRKDDKSWEFPPSTLKNISVSYLAYINAILLTVLRRVANGTD
jgi:hypothetical protein